MIYEQKSGTLLTDDGKLIYIGYSGYGLGKNNPEMQDVKNIGPIPCGKYKLQSVHDSDKTGPFTIVLIPHPENKMFNRSGFAVHGDDREHPGQASHGCCIFPRWVRELIWKSSDHYLTVISGYEKTLEHP